MFLTQPDVTFVAGNPLLLTFEGKFVAKNVVLLIAVLVVGANTQSSAPRRATHGRPRAQG